MSETKKCATEVWDVWRGRRCGNKALPGSDFCGVHDPERKKARAEKRGPTQSERMARAQQARWRIEERRADALRRISHVSPDRLDHAEDVRRLEKVAAIAKAALDYDGKEDE